MQCWRDKSNLEVAEVIELRNACACVGTVEMEGGGLIDGKIQKC